MKLTKLELQILIATTIFTTLGVAFVTTIILGVIDATKGIYG